MVLPISLNIVSYGSAYNRYLIKALGGGGINHHTLLHIHHIIHRNPDTGPKYTTLELEDMGYLLPEEEGLASLSPKG